MGWLRSVSMKLSSVAIMARLADFSNDEGVLAID